MHELFRETTKHNIGHPPMDRYIISIHRLDKDHPRGMFGTVEDIHGSIQSFHHVDELWAILQGLNHGMVEKLVTIVDMRGDPG